MKKLLLFVPLAFVSLSLSAQTSFRLINYGTGATVTPNATINVLTQPETNFKVTIDVLNTTAGTQSFTAKRYDMLLNTATGDVTVANAYFCFGGTCYDNSTLISPYNLVLTTGQKASQITCQLPPCYQMLVADLDECSDVGHSIVRYTFANVSNPMDSAQITMEYNNPVFVGIKENNKTQSKFKLFPNPSNNGIVTLKADNDFTKVEVVNQLGSVVLSKSTSPVDGKISLDLSSVAAGVYYVRISSANKLQTEKLVITSH